jgi:hypothetical protein
VLLRRDDHVLVSTRLVAVLIIPFLVAAFVVLYFFPKNSARLFAWPIRPTMTSMMLASTYIGGAYFFVRVLSASHWKAIKSGFLPVTLFAQPARGGDRHALGDFQPSSCDVLDLGNAVFHDAVSGIWSMAGQPARRRSVPATDELRLGPPTQWLIGIVGLLALVQGLIMFVAPGLVMHFWPWSLAVLSCRVALRSSVWGVPAWWSLPTQGGAR